MTTSTPRRNPANKSPLARKPGVRELAAQDTRDSILRAATKIFAKHGFSGGRIDEISKAAKSYDRMIYYYFGSKEDLFIAVLEDMYRKFNEAEMALELSSDQPEESLKAVIAFMWNFYQRNPEFITLLNDENLHRGKHISKSLRAREYSSPAIQIIEQLMESGVRKKVFRSGVSARDVYLMIAAMNYFYLSNRHTLSAFLGEKLESPEALAHWQGFVVEAVLRTVKP
ncbi:TetR/AcrR family transcriptional regulator [Ramlibacter sp. WS9]|uniref:TetR/AcrR family transcriptional regulator n=1 Tax=Ramlibacter sp. WS9 TaxID=1882741 RepID=UPI0011441B84|nr:TetR/AcrR family transcriptional regulator [Ramlibacter sp. WS9]ROZ66059.1 TetR/AcrR family transcriptional regulator [Ramlibacter sp. WS9]